MQNIIENLKLRGVELDLAAGPFWEKRLEIQIKARITAKRK